MNNKECKIAKDESHEKGLSDGNKCVALGLGVGGFGALATLATGAVCPLCVIVTPALIGTGLIKRIWEKKKKVTTQEV